MGIRAGLLIVLAGSCATAPMSPDLRRAAAQVRLIEGAPPPGLEGVSFSDNCWKSIRCVGDAGRLP